MSKNKPTVTIAVCAYNEEQNIASFLKSVLAQVQTHFVIKKVLVISDGSDDHTVKIASSVKSSLVEVWNFKNRLGKSSRLNQLNSSIATDYLVQSDADVVFGNRYAVWHLLRPLQVNSKAVMSGGNPTPLPALSFVEQAVNVTTDTYRIFRKNVRGGNNVFSADGRLLGFKKVFVQRLRIPKTMIANDAFAYFSCLSLGFTYKFAAKSIVYYRSPRTISDHIKQNTRFMAAPLRMKKYFDPQLIKNEYEVPQKLYLKETLLQFSKYPAHCLFIFFLNRFCSIKASLTERDLNAKWPIAISSKSLRLKLLKYY